MPLPHLIAVAAVASNRVIGREGKLPWHLPEDLKFFRQTTVDHSVLMGRKTFESIIAALGKPLPKRQNIILSRSMAPRDGVEVIRGIDDLGAVPGVSSTVYLIGGAQLYAALLPRCAEIYLTRLEDAYEGDALFPAFEGMFEAGEVLGKGQGFEIRRYVRKETLG